MLDAAAASMTPHVPAGDVRVFATAHAGIEPTDAHTSLWFRSARGRPWVPGLGRARGALAPEAVTSHRSQQVGRRLIRSKTH